MIQDIIAQEFAKTLTPKIVEKLQNIYHKCRTSIAAWNDSKTKNKEKFVLKISGEDQFLQRLETIVVESSNWSRDINFKDLQTKKSLLNHFVAIDFFLTPVSTHFDTHKETKKTLSCLLRQCEDHLIILGGPGAGKTTVTKYITLEGFQKADMFNGFNYTLPLLIRLREFNSLNFLNSFFWTLLNFLGIDLTVEHSKRMDTNDVPKIVTDSDIIKLLPTAKQLAVDIIDSLNVILILDGLDELSNSNFVTSTVQDVRQLCLSLQNSKIILTSRTGEYYSAIDNATTVEIAPLSENQITEFVEKWMINGQKSQEFLLQLRNSPFWDTAIRPINLAHLCALFLRYQEIPKKPRTVYEKIVMLLIEEWDLQRDIKRPSKFDSFASIRKKEFLCALSFELTKKHKTSIFSKAQLNAVYMEISSNFDLGNDEVTTVINEIESHTGLFIQSGYDKCEFSHKSLQEYLTADYLIRYPKLMRLSEKVMHMPNEYAIAISLSSNPSSTFYDLFSIDTREKPVGLKTFSRNFILRLIVENPDFNSSPYTAIAVAKIATIIGYSEDTAENIHNLLHSHPNIKRSFRGLQYYFRSSDSDLPADVENIDQAKIYSIKESFRFDDDHSPTYEVISLNAEMVKLYLENNIIE